MQPIVTPSICVDPSPIDAPTIGGAQVLDATAADRQAIVAECRALIFGENHRRVWLVRLG